MSHSVVPNTAMLASSGERDDTRRRGCDVRPVMIDNIVVGDRQRPIDPDKSRQIAESFRELGQLQPIGVKRRQGQPFVLIYGRHRLEAKMILRESDPSHDVIAAVIFPEEMTDWQCELAEVAENLHRKELTPKERDAHTAIYAGLLKQNGSVVEGNTARSRSEARTKGKKGCDPSDLGHMPPTVTRKTAADLGITDEAVRNRIKNASKLAARNGVTVNKATPEAMSGEELIKVGHSALKAAEADKAEAHRLGKSPRYIKPHEPAKETVTTARLDVADPAPFIAWCRLRINGKHKPMSIDILKTYAAALASLITEIENLP